MTRSSSRRVAAIGLFAAATLTSGLAFLPGASAAVHPDSLGKGQVARAATTPFHSDKAPSGASPAISTYQQVTSGTLVDAAGTETFASVTCPRGKVVGGGAVISGVSLNENINSSAPSTDGKSWRVWVNNANSVNGSFVAYAVCAKNVGLYQVVTGTSTTNAAGVQSTATVTCPAGKVPYGGGGIIGSSATTANLNTSIPFSNGWRVDVNNNTASATSTTAYVVCGKQVASYSQVAGTPVTVSANSQAGASVTCPTGTVPMGGGSFSSSGSVLVNLNSSFPLSNGWRAYQNNATSSSNTITAYAVCAHSA